MVLLWPCTWVLHLLTHVHTSSLKPLTHNPLQHNFLIWGKITLHEKVAMVMYMKSSHCALGNRSSLLPFYSLQSKQAKDSFPFRRHWPDPSYSPGSSSHRDMPMAIAGWFVWGHGHLVGKCGLHEVPLEGLLSLAPARLYRSCSIPPFSSQHLNSPMLLLSLKFFNQAYNQIFAIWLPSNPVNMTLGPMKSKMKPNHNVYLPLLLSQNHKIHLFCTNQTSPSQQSPAPATSLLMVLVITLPNSQEEFTWLYQKLRNWGKATVEHLKEAQRSCCFSKCPPASQWRICLGGGNSAAGDGTQDLLQVKHMPYHWATLPAQI